MSTNKVIKNITVKTIGKICFGSASLLEKEFKNSKI